MTSYVTPKKNTAFVFGIGLPSQASSGTFQSNPTLAAGDFKISKDGGALANLTNLPTVNPASGKRVELSLTSTEMNADNISIICSDAAGSEWFDVMVGIQTTARQIDDLAYPATSGRSMVVDAAGLVDANTVKVGPTGSGTAQTAGDIMADTNDIQARLPAALVSGRMDASVGAMAANVMTAAAAAADLTTELQTGLATAASLATTDGKVDAINAKTTNLPSDPADESLIIAATDAIMSRLGAPAGASVSADIAAIAAVSAPTANQNADALLDRVDGIETGFTLRQVMRLVSAVLAGKASGLDSNTAVYRDLGDTKNRIVSTVDGEGNRTDVVKDVS